MSPPVDPGALITSHADLALFLNGTNGVSFTTDLLRLMDNANGQQLARLSSGYPREVAAFEAWKAAVDEFIPVKWPTAAALTGRMHALEVEDASTLAAAGRQLAQLVRWFAPGYE